MDQYASSDHPLSRQVYWGGPRGKQRDHYLQADPHRAQNSRDKEMSRKPVTASALIVDLAGRVSNYYGKYMNEFITLIGF